MVTLAQTKKMKPLTISYAQLVSPESDN